jgi:Uma2 family endonuclease
MSDPLREEDEKIFYTYADYLAWETHERYELMDGVAYMMASPSVSHQAVSGELFLQFGNFLKGKPCRVFAAPLDVRLFPQEDKNDDTVMQPDLLVVCDRTKLSKGSCDGPPDLVIEIISSSNTRKELFKKFNYYLDAGVQEYWVVDSDSKTVQVHVLDQGHFISAVYKENDSIPVSILPGLNIELKPLWAENTEATVQLS